MPDNISDDLLADTFAQFRTRARPEIQPPGAESTRRTVYRRRTARLAGVIVLMVTTLVATGIGALRITPADRQAPGAEPTFGPDRLAALSVQALAALGYAPTTGAPTTPAGLLPMWAGVFHAGVDGNLARTPHRLGSTDHPLPSGQYNVDMACVGVGRLIVVWEWTGGTFGGSPIDCGGTHHAEFSASVAGVVDITVTPDDDAVGRAGVAVAITDPRAVRARNLLGERPRTLTAGDSVLYTALKDGTDPMLATGTYRLSVACVGSGGTVTLSLAVGGADDGSALECPAAGAKTTLTVRATLPGRAVSIMIDPRGTTPGSAAVAYWLEKV
jgi:hypothetical protein